MSWYKQDDEDKIVESILLHDEDELDCLRYFKFYPHPRPYVDHCYVYNQSDHGTITDFCNYVVKTFSIKQHEPVDLTQFETCIMRDIVDHFNKRSSYKFKSTAFEMNRQRFKMDQISITDSVSSIILVKL